MYKQNVIITVLLFMTCIKDNLLLLCLMRIANKTNYTIFFIAGKKQTRHVVTHCTKSYHNTGYIEYFTFCYNANCMQYINYLLKTTTKAGRFLKRKQIPHSHSLVFADLVLFNHH